MNISATELPHPTQIVNSRGLQCPRYYSHFSPWFVESCSWRLTPGSVYLAQGEHHPGIYILNYFVDVGICNDAISDTSKFMAEAQSA